MNGQQDAKTAFVFVPKKTRPNPLYEGGSEDDTLDDNDNANDITCSVCFDAAPVNTFHACPCDAPHSLAKEDQSNDGKTATLADKTAEVIEIKPILLKKSQWQKDAISMRDIRRAKRSLRAK